MSNGLNKEFMKDPEAFMMTKPIDIWGGTELDGADNTKGSMVRVFAGLHDFDLENGRVGSINLRHFPLRRKAATSSSHRIHAYWLPWTSRGAASIQLGTEADYFFTSALGGCRIQIGAGANPLVMHIAGDMRQADREALARDQMPDYAASRRFSVTTEYPGTGMAFLVGKAYTTGVFTKTRRWRFFAQGIGFDENGPARKMLVASLRVHENGVIEV